ncbi:MAG: CBS domain-containing protein [Pseudonocardiales bacterium]|nr:CBS domain-containing protein [Pseudonocardiales bacterium]
MTTWPDLPRDITAVAVSAVMSRDVLVVGPQDPVVEVWQRMQNLRASVAVVCDATRVVAVVSERTLAVWWPSGGPGEIRRRQVRDIIDSGTPTVHADTTVHQAADLMIHFQLDGVPVVTASGELLGLVTHTDLVRLLALGNTGLGNLDNTVRVTQRC